MYFEQDQLFRFNGYYSNSFFTHPGGFLAWLTALFVQFFIWPWLGGAVVTGIAFLIFLLVTKILKFHKFYGFVFSFFLPLLLAMPLSGQTVGFLPFVGLLLILVAFYGYISISKFWLRVISGIAVLIPLYMLTGMFAFVFGVMIILSEIARDGKRDSYLISAACLAVMAFTPFLMRYFVYFVTVKESYFAPFDIAGNWSPFYSSFAAMLFVPFLILLSTVFKKVQFSWNLKYVISAVIPLVTLLFFLLHYSYDPRNNKLQEIDYHVQRGNWEKVLKLAPEYPGRNQLVLYYTNLALHKTGRMGDQLFFYPQSGTKGLWLEWKRNEVNPFYGGEIFYQLGFSNEAFRWAFEAMEAKGINPRSLKRLAVTSIINNRKEVALKYTRFLKQSLFYREQGVYYESLIENPELLKNDLEISELQSLVPKRDFISYMSQDDIGFFPLLENNPKNRMAFEYMMASFLLNKNLNGFAANLYRLKELGYTRIPVHFEEAIIVFTGVTKKNILPEGYAISQASQQKFHTYAEILNMYRDNMDMAIKALNRDFGNTFWFYMQFNNLEK
jgi:hypothetical protein